MYKYRNLFIYKVGSKKKNVFVLRKIIVVDLFYFIVTYLLKKNKNMTVAVSQLMFSMFWIHALHLQQNNLYYLFMMCFSVCPFSPKTGILIFDSFELSCFRYYTWIMLYFIISMINWYFNWNCHIVIIRNKILFYE